MLGYKKRVVAFLFLTLVVSVFAVSVASAFWPFDGNKRSITGSVTEVDVQGGAGVETKGAAQADETTEGEESDSEGGPALSLSGVFNQNLAKGEDPPTVRSWNIGVGGKAIHFGGRGYLQIPRSDAISPSDGVTVAGWFNMGAEWSNITHRFEGFVSTGSAISKRDSYNLDPHTDGSMRFWVFVNGQWRVVSSPANSVVLGEWQHWAGTYDGRTLKLYKNGKLIALDSVSGRLGTTGDLFIGYDGNLPGITNRRFIGMMDEIQIYGRALSDAEVGSLYTKQAAKLSGASGQEAFTCEDHDVTPQYPDGKNPINGSGVFCKRSSGEREILSRTLDICYSSNQVKEAYYDLSKVGKTAHAYIGEYTLVPCPEGYVCNPTDSACRPATATPPQVEDRTPATPPQVEDRTPATPPEASTPQRKQGKPTKCDGCYTTKEQGDKCVPYGTRLSGNYCSVEDTVFQPQKAADDACQNNFECTSNSCLSGKCLEAGLLEKILAWFKNFF